MRPRQGRRAVDRGATDAQRPTGEITGREVSVDDNVGGTSRGGGDDKAGKRGQGCVRVLFHAFYCYCCLS